MALTSETQPSPNGVDCIEHESAEILNDEDLEDGEIFEDEETANAKLLKANAVQEKAKVQITTPVAPPVQKKPLETEKNHKVPELNEKPPREQLVPFINKGTKKRHYENHEEDGRWKKEGKRTRKSHDLERDGERPGEEDEEMMLVVRGASPSRLEEEMEKWDPREEEMERVEVNRRPTRSYRGRGGVSRRGERARGRGRGRGNLRVGKRKRLDNRDMCQFFMQGRCHRGSDCPYSHDILPPRKPELCKFFMKDCCAKDDKCLYMHSEFPCKYFHTGMKCYANKKCKFNHGVLTDPLRNILAKHLDAAPKEIIGEFARRDGRDRDRDDIRDMRRDREPRDVRAEARDMRGDIRVDHRDMRSDFRDMRGDSRDMRGGDSRDLRGDARDMRGDSRDVRDTRGDLRDTRVDLRGDSRDIRGDSRDVRGDFRDIRSDSRDMRNDPRDMRGDLRDSRGGDMREFLRNKNDRDRKIPSLFDLKLAIPDEMRSSDGNHTPMPSPTQRSQDSTRSSERDRDHYSPDRERDREREKERERELEHERKRHEKSERSKERKAKKEKSREHKRERRERREKEREKRREHKDKTADTRKSFELMSPNQEADLNSNEVPSTSDRMHEHEKRAHTLHEDNSMFPEHLPKKQRELFLRIQQQQREAENSQASENDDDEDDKMAEENWYSSDEETTPSSTLPSILKNLAQSSATSTTTSSNTASSSTVLPILNLFAPVVSAAAKSSDAVNPPNITPVIPANLDLTNLSSVLEALNNLQKINATKSQQEVASNTTIALLTPELPPEPSPPEPPKPEPPRVRDPRLRIEGSAIESRRSSVDNYPTDVDLRLKSGGKAQLTADVDLRSLPFKPVQHTAACEIEASLASHPPLAWHLAPITVVKADYASLQIQPRPGINDPRLRWKMRSPTDESGLPRDPRQRLLDEPVRDPRARQPLLATPDIPPSPIMSGPPPTPRYDEDHRPQLFRMDSDMRFPPPTPRLEDEVYTPGPSRPMDPRQRSFGIEDPRRSHFPGRPDDVDLRPQIPQGVPFMNYK